MCTSLPLCLYCPVWVLGSGLTRGVDVYLSSSVLVLSSVGTFLGSGLTRGMVVYLSSSVLVLSCVGTWFGSH
jgi:hypothetical protein